MGNDYANMYASIREVEDSKYLNSLPIGIELNVSERIVCSANKYGDLVVAGVRHACGVMSGIHRAFDDRHTDLSEDFGDEVQGFVTNRHRFVDRQEAWKIAVSQRQIIRRVGGDASKGGTLYSENLY